MFIGIDASTEGLRQLSNRALRDGIGNLLYVRAAVEALPPQLAGAADRVIAILPWGSLLAALVRPVVPSLQGVRALCRAGAVLTVVFGLDAERDRAETLRLGIPDLTAAHLRGALAEGYAAAGFRVGAVHPVRPEGLRDWPSSWARRLAFGSSRRLFRIEALAAGPLSPAASPERWKGGFGPEPGRR